MARFRFTPKNILWLKVFIHSVSWLFVVILVKQITSGELGADPVKGIEHFTGKATLNTLFITLMISPFAKYFKQGLLIRVRRLLGLYCFFWAVLHLVTYLTLDLDFDWQFLGSEIVQRPYLAIGATAWFILMLLAVTSPAAVRQQLAGRWQSLHNWVYVALILGVIHYYWSVKSGLIEPSIYIVIAIILLAFRWKKFKR